MDNIIFKGIVWIILYLKGLYGQYLHEAGTSAAWSLWSPICLQKVFFLLIKVLKILFLKLFYFRLNFINLSICAYKFLSPFSFAKFQKSLNFQNFVLNCVWNQFISAIIQNMTFNILLFSSSPCTDNILLFSSSPCSW